MKKLSIWFTPHRNRENSLARLHGLHRRGAATPREDPTTFEPGTPVVPRRRSGRTDVLGIAALASTAPGLTAAIRAAHSGADTAAGGLSRTERGAGTMSHSPAGEERRPTVDASTNEGPRTELDVRPILAAGGEPYSMIMEAVEHLAPGGTLVLRSPFDPTPLHRVLAGLGFSHATREGAPGDWETEYRRSDEEAPLVLDVRGLRPPEPLERTLEALEDLPAGRSLLQLNDRVPAFLLPLLDERGYRYRIGEDERGTLVTIWREDGAS